MATSGDTNNEEENSKPTIDVAGFFQAFAKDDSDTDSDGEEGMSMFCKACLHPYSGEEKAGTIVLRCKNCGQTDTILEEKVGNINPQQWIGDLMKNRFLQVIKEQENLKMNLVDPNFCDDDYRRVTLSLQEYTQNIQAVAECMYDVVRQVNFPSLDDQLMVSVEREAVEIEAMRATNRLIKIHKALLENSQSGTVVNSTEEMEDTGSGRKGRGKKGGGKKGKGKKPPNEDAEFENDMKEIAEMTRQHSQTLGNTVLTLINELIDKYKLPDDLMERIEDRIIRQYSEEAEEEEKKKRAAVKDGKKKSKGKNKKGPIETNETEKGNEKAEKKKNEKDGEMKPESEKKVEKQVEKVVEKKQESEGNKISSDGGAKCTEVSNVESLGVETVNEEIKDPFEEQFYAALEEKFSIKFYDKELVKWSEEDEEDRGELAQGENVAGEPEESEKGEPVELEEEEEDEESKGATGGREENKGEKKERKQDLSMHFKKTSEGFMVNFYTLSAAFINELQAIKSQSLEKRKEKALAELHERIQMMKNEMEKIEDAVTAELAKAYERKMKKSAKQREKMDEKQKQLREAERLLCFYASTGQHDKIRAMNEELDKLCGNPN